MHRLYLCHGPHCSARGAQGLRAALDEALWRAGLLSAAEVSPSGCQDHCDHGPNMIVHPGAVRYCALDAARLRRIVAEHLAGGQPVAEYEATPAMRRSSRPA